MEITVNGETRTVDGGMNLTRLLELFDIGGERNLAIEHNGEFLDPEEEWDNVVIGEGDTLEIVHFVGGG